MSTTILPPARPGDKPTRIVLGDNHFVRVSGAQTAGQLTVIEQINPPGVGVPMHFHENEDETFHVVEGSVRFFLPDRHVDAGPGTTVFLPRLAPHGFQVVGNATSRVLLMLNPSGLEEMFNELAQLPPGPPDMGRVQAICGRYGIRFL